ncbi:MAG: glycosyltransferase [Sphaerochaetaceae bacterium]|nr:glycosyltransferase [Sphaerochaetaceae bacterium]
MRRDTSTTNKRIVIVIPGLSFGGAERVTSYLCNHFVDHGREVHIISLSKGHHAYPLSPAITIHEIDISQKKNKLGRYLFLVQETRTLIKQIHPASVLAMISYAASLTALATLALPIPLLVSERNDPNTSRTFSLPAKKVFFFVHRFLATRAVYQNTSARSYYFKKENPKAVIIPNPLYLQEMPQANAKLQRSGIIMTAGRLTKQKNHQLLIKAFSLVHKHFPKYQLWIYGEGEEKEHLVQAIQEYALEGVVFLPGNEPALFTRMQEAEMFVMSSDYEGMPNALIEAMAMGLPCITTDYSGGRGTVVEHRINGLVVSRNNAQELASAIEELIEDDELASMVASHAKELRSSLDAETICSAWLATIEETEKSYMQRS